MAKRAEVIALHKKRKSPTEIAAELGTGVPNIYNHLRRAGLKPHGTKKRGRPAKAKAETPVTPTPPTDDGGAIVYPGAGGAEPRGGGGASSPESTASIIQRGLEELLPKLNGSAFEDFWIKLDFQIREQILKVEAEIIPLKALLDIIENIAPVEFDGAGHVNVEVH